MTDVNNDMPLFRETALSAFAKRSYGRPIAKMPRSWMYFSIMLLALVATAAWFLATSTYSRKESALGWLAPKDGLVRISVSEVALVEKVMFEQGAGVKKGEAIFIVSQDKKMISGNGNTEEFLEKLKRERDEIVSQIEIEKTGSTSDVREAKKLLAQLVLEQNQVASQIQQQEERVEVQREVYERFDLFYKKNDAVTYLQLQNQKEQFLSQKQALSALLQRQATLGREELNARSILTSRPLDSRRTLSELQRRIIELENRETDLKTRGAQAIQAPISGTIATLEVQAGNTVYPQQLLASLLPEESNLYAEVYIPSRAIGFIKPEQAVRVMYAAFPHQRFGAANGVVLEVSNTVLRPEEIPTSIGLKEPAYKARIELDKQTMEGFGSVLPLRPGMALEAEIILEKRSFLQWVLEPLRARRTG